MLGSGNAGVVAQVVFWGLVIWGEAIGELGTRARWWFLGLWLAALLGSGFLGYAPLFTTFVAILDIALVLIIFKGDVQIR